MNGAGLLETVKHLNNRPFWKIKAVKESHDNVVKFLMLSYRNLVEFAAKASYSLECRVLRYQHSFS